MFPKILKFSFLIFFLTVIEVLAQGKLEIFPLQNRQVEDVIPVIRPLMGPNETVSGMHNQLIVRASPRKLREIKTILEKIDTRLKNLRITVKQGHFSQLDKTEHKIEAKIPIGEAGRVIINSGDTKSSGVVVERRIERGSVRGKILQRKSSLNDNSSQVITTLEGSVATIYITRQVPIKEVRNFRRGGNITQFESTRYKDVRSGFMVLPRIQGDRVILKISPQQSRIINGEINTVGFDTILSGVVGEWIEFGRLNQNRNEQGSGIGSRNRSGQVEKRSVFIKVEEQ
jgi:hypothetical protein